jgi:cellulose synthase/poly-beta-1,6-N-acetylglucosamine synthase-like glycosyltransferase
MPIDLTLITIAAIVFGCVWIYVNIYFVSPVYRKVFAKLFGLSRDPRVFDSESTIPDADVPTVDVLVPAYNERDTIGSTIRSLREANYPTEKLTVNVLVEASDHTTRAELFQLHQLYDFRELVVPAAYPGEQNKPRALNYGFEQTSGDIVGVIDAEDIVDPRLFREVVRALVEGGHDYAQGPLDLVNEEDGFLNTLFRGEYKFWYGSVIPSFLRVGYPDPLGGTTNFAWRSVLERASQERLDRLGDPWTEDQRARFAEHGWAGPVPWDPRNVTEDFELGLLLWETGHSLAMVTATTREESPIGLNGWVRQRTRWQKGKIYTFYQRLRTPPTSIRRAIHVYSHAATPHLGPMNILAILLIMIYANLIGFLAIPSVAGILLVGLAFATQQLLMQAWGYWQVTDVKGLVRVRRLMVVILGVPLYWVLQWGAAGKKPSTADATSSSSIRRTSRACWRRLA